MKQYHYSKEEQSEIDSQVHYYLGRVLYEGALDFDAAVSELETAVRLDPGNAGAYYHLGQAIREQIEKNKMKRVEDVLQIYLSKGAPLGHEDEIREYLHVRLKQGKQMR